MIFLTVALGKAFLPIAMLYGDVPEEVQRWAIREMWSSANLRGRSACRGTTTQSVARFRLCNEYW